MADSAWEGDIMSPETQKFISQSHSSQSDKRYCLVQNESCDWYVIEDNHVDEWFTLDDDEISDGPEWAWPVNGALNQVTFTHPLIFGEPLSD